MLLVDHITIERKNEEQLRASERYANSDFKFSDALDPEHANA
jgi:hypothetical protein